ncbi:MAG: hypothetical protein MUE33_00090 [Cytophagaceae bacterium]|nr:hypothetical protein [Cytophagaceae bacterium]
MRISILSLAVFLLSISSYAMDSLKRKQMPDYRYYISVSSFFTNSNTTVRLDGRALGTYLSLENDFLLQRNSTDFRSDVSAFVSPRSQLAFTYFSINRNQKAEINRDFYIKDSLIEIGATLITKFNVSYIAATYRYSIFRQKNWCLGFSSGLRLLGLNFGFEALEYGESKFKFSERFLLPVALIGIHGQAYITPRLLGKYSFEIFGLQIQGIKGVVLDQHVSLDYFIFKNVSLGLAYSTIKYQLTDYPIKEFIDGEVSYVIVGASLSLQARF